jgi:trans-aconitate methyltransferase
LSLADTERALYEQVWASVETYGTHSPGEQTAGAFRDLVMADIGTDDFRRVTVLDAGCGSGKGGVALHKLRFDVRLCDITDAGLVEEARTLPFTAASVTSDLRSLVRSVLGRTTFDYVYCCDVLEHLPTQFTMLAVDHMLRVTRNAVWMAVSFMPDNNGIWVGEVLHKTVQPFVWWRDSLKELGAVTDARDLQHSGVFVVRPR